MMNLLNQNSLSLTIFWCNITTKKLVISCVTLVVMGIMRTWVESHNMLAPNVFMNLLVNNKYIFYFTSILYFSYLRFHNLYLSTGAPDCRQEVFIEINTDCFKFNFLSIENWKCYHSLDLYFVWSFFNRQNFATWNLAM